MTAYRGDIEGLRAIAVSSIVLYHFGFVEMSGGFVGVDIFFAISGFLIGRTVIEQNLAGTFSLAEFFRRRIRRLFPALMAMLVVSSITFYFLLLPVDLRNFGKSMIATAVYVSNVVFFRESGYFDPGAINKPLLHTWSLGVEEQFYIVFPLIMMGLVRLTRNRKAIIGVLLAIAILSLASSELYVRTQPTAAFFLLPFRFWELLAGVLTGFLAHGWLGKYAGRWREIIATAGLALILFAIFTYREVMPFPGIAAIPPAIGAAMVIAAGTSGNSWVARFLSLRPFALIGLVSYSIYLWHWPLVVGLSYYWGGPIPIPLRLGGLAATVLLAALSYRYIEQPFRRSGGIGKTRTFALAAVTSLAIIAIGTWFYRSEGLPGRFSEQHQKIAYAAGDFLQNGGICVTANNPQIPGLAYCLLGDRNAKPDFLVWGDSHGRAYRDGIDQAAREAGRSGILVWAGGCPPLIGVRKVESATGPDSDRECLDQNHALETFLASDTALRSVLLIGRWSYYSEGRGVGTDAHNVIALHPIDGAPESGSNLLTDAMQRTADGLRGQGRRILILEQTPEIPAFSARGLAQQVLVRHRPLTEVLPEIGVTSLENVDRRQRASEAAMDRLEKSGQAIIIRTHSSFCAARTCSAWQGDQPAMFDNNHITVETSKKLRHVFAPLFAR